MRLSNAWQSLREHQDYPPAVQQLLGEAVGAVLLLAATLKFDGTLTLQLQGKGLGLVDMHLLAACTIAGSPLWTLDAKLRKAASQVNVAAD